LEDDKLKRMWTEEVSPNKKENYENLSTAAVLG
jgi:hypothetical protein